MRRAVVRPVVAYVGPAVGLRASHCREQAARFRWVARREPLPPMRRYLRRLAGLYDELAEAQELGGYKKNRYSGFKSAACG